MSDTTMRAAFMAAYADMANPKKNASNPAFKSKYANLEELLNVTRPVLAANGFALVQQPVNDQEYVGVRTKLLHTGGEEMDFGTILTPLSKHDAQGVGSAITYCRRYAIAAVFGLAQEDDDGNAASQQSYGRRVSTLQKLATDKQKAAMFAAAKANGWSNDLIKAHLVLAYGVEKTDDLKMDDASEAIDWFKANKPKEIPQDAPMEPNLAPEPIEF